MELELSQLSEQVIGCAIEVHKELGSGFLEGIYERAFLIELKHAGIPYKHQEEHPVLYRGEEAGRQRYDILIDERLLIELKAVKSLEPIHFAQTRSYLKALGLNHGIPLNFAAVPLTIKRVLYDPNYKP